MADLQRTYQALVTELREIATLSSIGSVLGWDERTYMPPKAAAHRAKQGAIIARLSHDRFTSPRVGEWLRELEGSALVADARSDAAVNVRETRRAYDRATKLPTKLVEELTETATLAEAAWAEAKVKSDYAAFKPWLARTLDLKRQQAACYGGPTYDALLEDFEPGASTSEITAVFAALRGPLVELVGQILDSGNVAPREILHRTFPVEQQRRLSEAAAASFGYDTTAGRLDVSSHPFSTELGPSDARITTRYQPDDLADSFFSTLHETGHALYSQGLPGDHWGTPRGEYVSLGIHESQSRMWENLVGRSRGFWRHWFPKAQDLFGPVLADVREDDFYRAVNAVRRGLIRTESDEATYNLHVLLRFELEQVLLSGDLSADDLPAEWNARMKSYLGVTVRDDRHGVLQDVHWSGGAFGYFPTYTLGNLYAAQFFEQANHALGDLEPMFAAGEYRPLLTWLQTNIHSHGKRYTAPQLVQHVTGRPLTPDPLLRHLRAKARDIYGVR